MELVDYIARDLGLQQELFDTPFEGIQSGEALNTRKGDVAAAAITITPTRQQNMNFSDPYFDADQALLVKKGAADKELAALRGKVLGVQLGTTGEEYANEHRAEFGYQVRQYEDVALLESSVQNGSVDAAINDNGVLLHFAKNNPDTEVSTEIPTGEKYGIGVQQGNGLAGPFSTAATNGSPCSDQVTLAGAIVSDSGSSQRRAAKECTK